MMSTAHFCWLVLTCASMIMHTNNSTDIFCKKLMACIFYMIPRLQHEFCTIGNAVCCHVSAINCALCNEWRVAVHRPLPIGTYNVQNDQENYCNACVHVESHWWLADMISGISARSWQDLMGFYHNRKIRRKQRAASCFVDHKKKPSLLWSWELPNALISGMPRLSGVVHFFGSGKKKKKKNRPVRIP